MIKTGITCIRDIKEKSITPLCKQLKNVTITLYDKILLEPDSEELAERILLLFSDERGAYKRTYAKRFEEFDLIILGYLEEFFKTGEVVFIQDVGVSDGRTALDFFKRVSAIFPKLTFVASDYNPKVYVLEKGKCKVTISHTGKVLEILWPPFVFNAIKRDSYRRYPLNYLIQILVQNLVVSPLLKAYHEGKLKAKELMLFAPQVLNTVKNDARFILDQHNLLSPFKEKAHIVRAMNVLNPSYFTQDEFSQVISHIHFALLEGGLFITGSNQDAGTLVQGGIYKKAKSGFQKIWQSGEGSPIESIILGFNK